MGLFSKSKAKADAGPIPAAAPKLKKKEPSRGKSAKKDVERQPMAAPPPQPLWDDAWTRRTVEPEEVHHLLRACTHEMKSRALDSPFLLLPFRPTSDPGAARTFVRKYFSLDNEVPLQGEVLQQELLLTEPMIISSVMKWCWSRLEGGIVTWDAYELFRVGEQDSNYARDAFNTFIPLSIETDARVQIALDFFDLLAAIAARGKTNGMSGRKLSRYAGWWAFDHDSNKGGFDAGYRSWIRAADATSHLFFAYLRSLSPDSVKGLNGISTLPLSLQGLLTETKYPPEIGPYHPTSRVVMVVDTVSPTPFALLRRAKHFEYRDDDEVLQAFTNFTDPIQALSNECRRVLKSISATNEKSASNPTTDIKDASWSRFEDMGFRGLGQMDSDKPSRVPQSRNNDHGRPTTPSWADFLSSGFVEDGSQQTSRPLILPPDKILPPIDLNHSEQQISPQDADLEPGELASINALNLDDAFWWTWITSLAAEETPARKSAFGRCAVIETEIHNSWLVIEEMVQGSGPAPDATAYIAEKKSRFPFGRKRNMSRSKSMHRNPATEPVFNPRQDPASKTSLGRDQHARIQAAAAALQDRQKVHQEPVSPRRGRAQEEHSSRTNSVFTLQPVLLSEAAPAMRWAKSYDRQAVRAQYLGEDNEKLTQVNERLPTIGQDSEPDGTMTPKVAEPPQEDEETPIVIPERQEEKRKRLQKKDGRLKTLFKKKPVESAPAVPIDPMATAAARSALTSKSRNQSSQSLVRRLSRTGRSPRVATSETPPPMPEPEESQYSASRLDSDDDVQVVNHEPESPARFAQQVDYEAPTPQTAHISAHHSAAPSLHTDHEHDPSANDHRSEDAMSAYPYSERAPDSSRYDQSTEGMSTHPHESQSRVSGPFQHYDRSFEDNPRSPGPESSQRFSPPFEGNHESHSRYSDSAQDYTQSTEGQPHDMHPSQSLQQYSQGQPRAPESAQEYNRSAQPYEAPHTKNIRAQAHSTEETPNSEAMPQSSSVHPPAQAMTSGHDVPDAVSYSRPHMQKTLPRNASQRQVGARGRSYEAWTARRTNSGRNAHQTSTPKEDQSAPEQYNRSQSTTPTPRDAPVAGDPSTPDYQPPWTAHVPYNAQASPPTGGLAIDDAHNVSRTYESSLSDDGQATAGADAGMRAPEHEMPMTPDNRWAQIRQHAAQRAAQSRDGSVRGEQAATPRSDAAVEADAGAEGDEETIESRVARIKARVAELTGNMQPGVAPA